MSPRTDAGVACAGSGSDAGVDGGTDGSARIGVDVDLLLIGVHVSCAARFAALAAAAAKAIAPVVGPPSSQKLFAERIVVALDRTLDAVQVPLLAAARTGVV